MRFAEEAGGVTDDVVVGFGFAGGGGAGPGEVDVDGVGDAAGVRGEDDDARGEEDGFGDRVRDEQDSPATFRAQTQKLFVHAVACHLVKGSKWFVDAGAGDGFEARARAIETRIFIPPESCRG